MDSMQQSIVSRLQNILPSSTSIDTLKKLTLDIEDIIQSKDQYLQSRKIFNFTNRLNSHDYGNLSSETVHKILNIISNLNVLENQFIRSGSKAGGNEDGAGNGAGDGNGIDNHYKNLHGLVANPTIPTGMSKHLIKYNENFDKMESKLVSELKYTLTGLSSESFRFTELNNRHSIKIEFQLHDLKFDQISTLYEFIEISLISKQIGACSDKKFNSIIKTSFTTIFLKHFQLRYVEFVNNLFLSNDLHSFSFLTLKFQLNDWIVKLKFVYFLVLNLEKLNVTEFLSLLANFTKSGDIIIRKVSKNSLQILKNLYLELLNSWMFSGELELTDSNNENLFIAVSQKKNSNDNNDKQFTFVKGNIPNFLNTEMSYLIFQIGKTLFFLKNNCDELIFCENFKKQYSSLKGKLNFKLVKKVYNEITAYTNSKILYGEFGFINQIDFLHNFLLTKQGDFLNALILNGQAVLNKSSNLLSGHQLISLLNNSIENTSVKFNYNSLILNRLDARILNIENLGLLGWNLFTIDYNLKEPINFLIGKSKNDYLKIFNFLFKIKKNLFFLNETWVDSNFIKKNLIKKFKKLLLNKYNDSQDKIRLNWILKTFKRLNILRNQFINFINLLQNFITNEIIIKNYNFFQSELFINQVQVDFQITKSNKLSINSDNAAKNYNLDELITLHNNYIKSIITNKIFDNSNTCLIGKYSSRSYIEEIYIILNIIENFINLDKEFKGLLIEMISVIELIKKNFEMEEADKFNDYLMKIDDKLNKMMEFLTAEIIEKFEDEMTVFTNDLKIDNDENLRCFGFRLDTE